jgi:hypothetical protein
MKSRIETAPPLHIAVKSISDGAQRVSLFAPKRRGAENSSMRLQTHKIAIQLIIIGTGVCIQVLVSFAVLALLSVLPCPIARGLKQNSSRACRPPKDEAIIRFYVALYHRQSVLDKCQQLGSSVFHPPYVQKRVGGQMGPKM